MLIFRTFENTIQSEFIEPLLDNPDNLQSVEELLILGVNHLRDWLLFKYLFEYTPEIRPNKDNIGLFGEYLTKTLINYIKKYSVK